MDRIFTWLKNNSLYIISFCLIIFGFNICYGLEVLNPQNINWLMSAYHDWGQHYLGWAYFQEEPWHFPLGHIDHFNYPAGTNVGYTDSIPLMALFFKLFSFLLPDTFQYLGLWLFICHLLNGFYTVRILKLFKAQNTYVILSVILVAFAPVLIYRGLHPALCAHWLILASLENYLSKATSGTVKKLNYRQIIILILSALINPYLFLMVAGFNFILPFKNYFYDKLINLKLAVVYFVSSQLLVLLIWFLIGMVSFSNEVSMEVTRSYGLYGLNLNSFFNSSGFSSLFPEMPWARPQQYEGYAYLGVGIMVMFIISAAYVAIRIFSKNNLLKNRGLMPLFIFTLLITVFAITHQVTYDEKTVVEFPLLGIIGTIGSVFRACGRFVWVLYYVLFFFSIIIFINIKVSHKIKIPLMIAFTVLQMYDIKPLLTFRELPEGSYHPKKISEQDWTNVTGQFKRIISYPPFNNNLNYHLDYQDFCYIALKHKLPITSGYVARETGMLNMVFTDSLKMNLNEGLINDHDLFITSPANISDFYPLLYKKKAVVHYLDGYYYLYSANNNRNNFKFPDMPEAKWKIDSLYKEIGSASRMTIVPVPQSGKGNIRYNLETNNFSNNILQLKGWAYVDEVKDNRKDSIFVILSSSEKAYRIKTTPFERPDVTAAYEKGNVNNSGFSTSIFTDNLENKDYNLIIGIKDKNNKWTYESLFVLELKKPEPPKLITKLPQARQKTIGNVDLAKVQAGKVFISGWGAIEKRDATASSIKLLLIGQAKIYQMATDKVIREDVTNSYNKAFDYNNSGFKIKVDKKFFIPGNYTIALYITNKDGSSGLFTFGQKIKIK